MSIVMKDCINQETLWKQELHDDLQKEKNIPFSLVNVVSLGCGSSECSTVHVNTVPLLHSS